MRKVTQKFIREMISDGIARDIRGEYTGDPGELHRKYSGRERVYYSVGTYGLNGAVWRTEDGEFIAVPTRCSSLFILG